MINALPLFFGPLENPIQGNGQTGGIVPDQSKASGNPSDNPFAKILRDQSAASFLLKSLQPIVPSENPSDNPLAKILRDQSAASFLLKNLQPIVPSENPSDNPLAKILRDQSAASSLLKNLQLIVSSEDQKRLPDLESLPGNQDLPLQGLSGQDIPVDLLRESSSDIVALPLRGHVPPNPYLMTFLESDGQKLNEPEVFIPTSSIPLPSLAGNGRSEVGEVEIPMEQMGPSPGDISHEGELFRAIVSPPVFLAGGTGAEGVQTQTTINQPGLPFLTGYAPLQAPPVESSLAGKSATHIVTNSDRQQVLQDAVKGNSQLEGSTDGEPATKFAVEPGKNIAKPLDPVSRPFQDADTLLLRNPPSPVGPPQGPLRPLVNQTFQAPLPFEEPSASLTDVVQASQSRMKYVNGVSSVLSELPGNGKESSMSIPSDLLGDSSLSSSGDRFKDALEATGKSVGVDPNGGQGVNNGMGGSSHSQSGFQQSSPSLSQGSGVRIAEERGPDLPTPALQRLQMDVQLSETNRIQIDVGVQQRQVYAGLLMDQGTLRNLAVQFVPQLEDQLAQVDMDLQEFSAEVRDHHGEQESDTSSQWSGTQHRQRGSTTFQHAQESLPNIVRRAEERGLHLVA